MIRTAIDLRGLRLWSALVLAGVALCVPGCSGCLKDPVTAQQEAARKQLEEDAKRLEEERRKKEAEKPPFEFGKFMTQPNNLEMVESAYKPGHWTSATLEILANKEDFHGALITTPAPLDNMPYNLATSRPVTLAKKQKKAVEVTLYVPPMLAKGERFGMQLLAGGEREVGGTGLVFTKIPAHQFYFVVLSRDAERYAFLNELDSVQPPAGNLISSGGERYYKVLMPKIEQRVPLSTNPLCWTPIAYVLWDDLHPEKLTPEQQQAMLDWIHWGGQLIISGPGTLADLKSSLIAPYLPADGGEPWKITAETLADMDDYWTLRGPSLRPASAWSGQQLVPRPEARVLIDSSEGPLLVERRLGQGRIVLSAFRLGQRELQDWKSFDGFFNACLLRRGPRQFSLSDNAEVRVAWVPEADLPAAPPLERVDRTGRRSRNNDDPTAHDRLNPFLVSSVRFFTRDTDVPKPELNASYRVHHKAAEMEREPEIDPAQAVKLAAQALQQALAGEYIEEDVIGSGVAGWKDGNAVAQLARDALSGGIMIPDAGFILGVLTAYLLVLVPLNFLVFRLAGHVEWAWLAVPIITIGFAVAVVRLAQLDVGFVRTKSEVGVVEVQAGYPRAHVTRYTSLYTSLSTTYDLRFQDPSALVQPLPTSRLLKVQDRTDVHFLRDQPAGSGGEKYPVGLAGFDISSNSQAMLHSEHMLDLGGSIVLRTRPSGVREVVNNTQMELQDAAVIGPDGVAWIGKLGRGAGAALLFREAQQDLSIPAVADPNAAGANTQDIWVPEREKTAATARRFGPEVLSIRQLVRLAQNLTPLGEIRLVAWTTEEIPGLLIEPAASQARHANVVIARLRHAPEKLPRRDTNTRAEVEREEIKAEDEKPGAFP